MKVGTSGIALFPPDRFPACSSIHGRGRAQPKSGKAGDFALKVLSNSPLSSLSVFCSKQAERISGQDHLCLQQADTPPPARTALSLLHGLRAYPTHQAQSPSFSTLLARTCTPCSACTGLCFSFLSFYLCLWSCRCLRRCLLLVTLLTSLSLDLSQSLVTICVFLFVLSCLSALRFGGLPRPLREATQQAA